MNVKKIISLIMLLFMLLPLGAQNSEGKQRYKIAACDWMMLKRQKIGSFQLMKELGGDGIEMDMGGLGKRDTFDNKFHQPHFWLSGNFWLVSFKISYLCLPLFYETRTTPSCHPSGCAYRQL